jgi:hypothetical protein
VQVKKLGTEEWKRLFSRALVSGPPNSWKTTSLKTWPRPTHVLFFPGEKGASSLDHAPDLHGYTFEVDPATPMSARKVVKLVQTTTVEILSGKHGPIQTFAGDGLHKLYGIIHQANLDELISTYPSSDEDKLRGRAFGLAHEEFTSYLTLVCNSAVPRVVFTIWDGSTKDNAKDKSQDASSHIWPDLPGEMAKKIIGEVGAALYAVPGREVAPGKFSPGTWQTRRSGAVWGVGIKAPLSVVSRIPTAIPQDWTALEHMAFTEAPKPAGIPPAASA